MRRVIRVFVMALLAVAASGCIRYADIDQCMTRHKLRTLEKRFEQFNGTYQLGLPDRIDVNIPDHPDLSGSYTLRPDGNISFPLLGDVYAEGLTPMQLADLLTKRLERFVKKVEVLVTVIGPNSKVVFMYDRTKNGGNAYSFNGDMTVLDVLTLQRGWLRNEAYSSRVRLVRNNPEEREVYRIRADRFVRGDLKTNVLVREDDMVYVPATWLAEVVYFVELITRPITSVARGAQDIGEIPYSTREGYYESKTGDERGKERDKGGPWDGCRRPPRRHAPPREPAASALSTRGVCLNMPGAQQPAQQIDFYKYLRILWRRKWLLLIPLTLCLIVGVIFAMYAPIQKEPRATREAAVTNPYPRRGTERPTKARAEYYRSKSEYEREKERDEESGG